VNIAMGVNALRTNKAKNYYGRLRPYQVDPSIVPISRDPAKNPSYPSGHASGAYAAATVLEILWPQRAQEFEWWARQVALSRLQNGVHYPSDVIAGARLGRQAGLQTASILF
jgi:membrane-associated phospholipid phosphatase